MVLMALTVAARESAVLPPEVVIAADTKPLMDTVPVRAAAPMALPLMTLRFTTAATRVWGVARLMAAALSIAVPDAEAPMAVPLIVRSPTTVAAAGVVLRATLNATVWLVNAWAAPVPVVEVITTAFVPSLKAVLVGNVMVLFELLKVPV